MNNAAGTPRLVDEFIAAYERLGRQLPAELSVCGVFGDICWEPYPGEEIDRIMREEPAFDILTDLYHLAFQRVYGEIRYYAGPNARRSMLFSPSEMGMFDSVEDAAKFATLFLDGVEFEKIDIPRREPEWMIESQRRYEERWPPIDPATWQSVPCVTGRVATEDDLEARRALFVLDYTPDGASTGLTRFVEHGLIISESGDEPGTATPTDIPLPRCALLHEDENECYPAIAIQAERSPRSTRVGLRFIRGGRIVRSLKDVEFLDGPTEEFFAEYARALDKAAKEAARRAAKRVDPP